MGIRKGLKISGDMDNQYKFYRLSYGLLIILISLSALSCNNTRRIDSRLAEIENLNSQKNFNQAAAHLIDIDRSKLSEYNKKYYELLSIKVKDKLDTTGNALTNDSLILDLIDYFKDNGDKEIYAEALYYGGRVYKTIGDFPQALYYFKEAAVELPDDSKYNALESNIYYNTSSIMNSLRLYADAQPYLKKSYEIDMMNKDTLYSIYSRMLYGSNFIHMKNMDSAKIVFNEVKRLARLINNTFIEGRLDTYFAEICINEGDTVKALEYTRSSLKNVPEDHHARNYVLAQAAELYYDLGKYAELAPIAKELTDPRHKKNRWYGYMFLLKPEMRDFIPQDSLVPYVTNFYNLVNAQLSQNGDEEAIIQNAQYNYRIHEKQRLIAEAKQARMLRIIIWIVIGIMCIGGGILIWRIRRQSDNSRLIGLYAVINGMRRERTEGDTLKADSRENAPEEQKDGQTEETPDKPMTPDRIEDNIESIILMDYNRLMKKTSGEVKVNSTILQSEVYGKIENLLHDRKNIPDDAEIWIDMQKMVESVSPQFLLRARMLRGKTLSLPELHTALLLKCGFTPSQIGVLMKCEPSTVSKRRSAICRKLNSIKPEYVMLML